VCVCVEFEDWEWWTWTREVCGSGSVGTSDQDPDGVTSPLVLSASPPPPPLALAFAHSHSQSTSGVVSSLPPTANRHPCSILPPPSKCDLQVRHPTCNVQRAIICNIDKSLPVSYSSSSSSPAEEHNAVGHSPFLQILCTSHGLLWPDTIQP
jgi:hypothetical protein